MGLLSKLFAKLKPYVVEITCPNCGFPNLTKIPRGIKVVDFVKEGKCKCENCSIVFYPKEYKTKWLK
jgi:hypothetical protein